MIDSPLPICVAASIALAVALAIVAAAAPVLVHRPLRLLAFARAATHSKASATTPDRAMAKIPEAIRLRLAAALLDLGNHLMLPAEERKAFRLRKRLSSERARRLGLAAAAVRAGARRIDDVTLEIAIGESPQEGNPKRTLALSCVVYGPLDPDDGTEEALPLLARRQQALAGIPRSLGHGRGTGPRAGPHLLPRPSLAPRRRGQGTRDGLALLR